MISPSRARRGVVNRRPARTSPHAAMVNSQAIVPTRRTSPRFQGPIDSAATTYTARGGVGLDEGQSQVSRSLAFPSSPYEVAPVRTSTSVSSMSNSTGGRGKGAASTVSGKRGPSSTSGGGNMHSEKKKREFSPSIDDEDEMAEESEKEDDKDTDYVPVTDSAARNDNFEGGDSAQMAAIVNMHRRAFMERAFPPDAPFDNQHKAAASISSARPQAELDYIEYVVKHWQHGIELKDMLPSQEKEQLTEFRRQHPRGNKYCHQYFLEEIYVPGSDEPEFVVRRRETGKNKGKDRIVLSREKVFDAIDDWHRGNGHMGQERTWKFCRDKYWNVTEKCVRIYSETCLVCMKKNPPAKNVKGSIKPIQSWEFRDRFQIDLIDFRKLRKRDPFGVLMRWVMTLKDHATGFVYLCALPRKKPRLVAYKLQEIFGAIGYPKIFHTDNGKEFTAKQIIRFLRYLNPNILTVTGRPRRPRDQGSVENINKLVKRVLGSVLAERRLAGESPNWTEVLGCVAAVINSQAGRGKNDVSAYEAVFGLGFDHKFSCTKEDARKCWTINERMLLTNDAIFNENVEQDYILSDPENYMADEEQDDQDYFSDDDLSAHETDEVTDEFFYAHLLDGPISIHQSGTKKMSSSSAPIPSTTDAAVVDRDETATSVPDATTSSLVPQHTTTDANADAAAEKTRKIQEAYDASNRYWFGDSWKEVQEIKKLKNNDDRKLSGSDTDKDMKKNIGVFHGGEVETWDLHSSELGKVSEGYALVPIEEAWERIKCAENNYWLGCRLQCKICFAMTGHVLKIPVGNSGHIHCYRTSSTWFSQEFMTGFIGLVHHDAHMTEPPFKKPSTTNLLVARTSYSPPKTLTSDNLLDHGNATHFVSVAFNHSHFVVLYYNIRDRKVTVYDGLRMSMDSWAAQIIGTIKLYGFKPPDAKCRQEMSEQVRVNAGERTSHTMMELHFDDLTPWMVELDKSYTQSDGINCGPIACLKVLELYGFLKEGSIERIGDSPGGYRNVVMDYYSNCCILYQDSLKAEMRSEEKLESLRNKKDGTANRTDDARSVAMQKKNAKQKSSALKEMKRAGKAAMESGAAAGAVVTLHVDYRTHSHAQGLMAIVYDVKENTGGILVCCEHGVITHSGTKADYFVPFGKYTVVASKDDGIPLPSDLQAVRQLVLSGNFEPKTCPRISYHKLHEKGINATSPIKRTKGCHCRGGLCRKGCGCKKKGVTCHSGCSCLGNCSDK